MIKLIIKESLTGKTIEYQATIVKANSKSKGGHFPNIHNCIINFLIGPNFYQSKTPPTEEILINFSWLRLPVDEREETVIRVFLDKITANATDNSIMPYQISVQHRHGIKEKYKIEVVVEDPIQLLINYLTAQNKIFFEEGHPIKIIFEK